MACFVLKRFWKILIVFLKVYFELNITIIQRKIIITFRQTLKLSRSKFYYDLCNDVFW